MAERRIKCDFVKTASGTYLAERDLIEMSRPGDWPWLLRELKRLSDFEILVGFKDLALPPGQEGTWGFLSLPPYFLMCQLLTHEPQLWEFGAGGGMLKVVRVIDQSRSDLVAKYLAAAARNDDIIYE